ncbi:MAG: hypothetical protein R2730_15745 [Chitinophagales bacterium]
MKNQFILLMLLVTSITVTNAQNIWTVNNQPSFNADFTNLQIAVDSASAGDIIMLHGSSTSYGSLVIRKRIVIIGPGYLLGQNDAPNTQANPLPASISNLTFDSDPSGDIDASGSLVTGLTITNVYSSAASQTPINYTVQRCYIEFTRPGSYVTALFKENLLYYSPDNSYATLDLDGINNTTFENNIIIRGNGEDIVHTNNQNTGTFKNNTFVSIGANDPEVLIEGDGMSFINNLFLGDTTITVINQYGIGSVQNNMSNTTTFEGIASNITDANADNLVIGWSNPEGLSLDNRFTTKANAPSIGAGLNGENIGAFTTTSPYILSGIPFVPNIYALDAPDFGTTGSGITVNIKAKANN